MQGDQSVAKAGWMARTQIFDITGGGDAVDWEKNLFWLRIFLLLHVASRTSMALHSSAGSQETWLVVTYSLLIVVCVAGFTPRLTRKAALMAAGLLAIQILGTMPVTANHVFLEFLCLAIVGLLHQSSVVSRK